MSDTYPYPDNPWVCTRAGYPYPGYSLPTTRGSQTLYRKGKSASAIPAGLHFKKTLRAKTPVVTSHNLLDHDIAMADASQGSPSTRSTSVTAAPGGPTNGPAIQLTTTSAFAEPYFLRPGRSATIEDGVMVLSEGGEPILRYTAKPSTGFPRIDLGAPPLQNITRDLAQKWSELPPPKLLIAEDLIALACGAGAQNVIVSPPTQATYDPFRFPSPFSFLVSGISQSAADELLDLHILSTDKASLIFDPFVPRNPRHLITIRGLTFRNTTEAAVEVADIVRRRLVATPEIASHIHDHLMIADAGAVATAYASIQATSIEAALPKAQGGKQLLWNIEWDPPQVKLTNYFKLVHLVQDVKFPTTVRGTGLPLVSDLVFRCVGCKGISHPTPLCPLPDIPGWLGPRKAPDEDDDLAIDAFNRPKTNGANGGVKGKDPIRGGREGGKFRGGRGGNRGRGSSRT
ncbi:hypothetical protein FPV67DRAFT_1453852 [Lyophyllum atratum]|nr:hypothetical protein FPV67DRAFT_1453852 [Lyophyllum atratum]